jgi:hypothetical protein
VSTLPPDPEETRGPVGAVLRLFLTQLLVIVAVTALITTVFVLTGRDDSTPEAASQAGPTSATPSSRTATSSPSPSTSDPSMTTTTPPPSSTSAPPSRPPVPAIKVDVLNQSGSKGAAADIADRLRSRGWRVGRVDNFNGNVRETTVYYPDGQRGLAQRLAKDMPGSPRLRVRFSTLNSDRLSVILVR